MPKKNRLTGAEIRGLRSPRRVHGGLFSVSVGPSRFSEPRFACVVSKKVAAKAVARNLIKRRCRAIIEKEMKRLPPASYVLYAKKDAARAGYGDMEKDIRTLTKALRGA